MPQLTMQFLPKHYNTFKGSKLSTTFNNKPQFFNQLPSNRVNTITNQQSSVFSLYSTKGLGTMIKNFNSLPKGCKSCGH